LNPAVTAAIEGARNESQVDGISRAWDLSLTPEDLAGIENQEQISNREITVPRLQGLCPGQQLLVLSCPAHSCFGEHFIVLSPSMQPGRH